MKLSNFFLLSVSSTEGTRSDVTLPGIGRLVVHVVHVNKRDLGLGPAGVDTTSAEPSSEPTPNCCSQVSVQLSYLPFIVFAVNIARRLRSA